MVEARTIAFATFSDELVVHQARRRRGLDGLLFNTGTTRVFKTKELERALIFLAIPSGAQHKVRSLIDGLEQQVL